jgi:hypothetical protein
MNVPDGDYIFKHFREPRSAPMKRNYKFVFSVAALVAASCTAALAQSAPPTYQADPSVYKIIFEDQNFRVITGTWAPGVTDKPHSHRFGGLCTYRLHVAGDFGRCENCDNHPQSRRRNRRTNNRVTYGAQYRSSRVSDSLYRAQVAQPNRLIL